MNAFGLIVFVVFIIIMFTNKQIEDEVKGRFYDRKNYNGDSLLEAYLFLGAKLIKMDTDDAGKKVRYMNSYFKKYFPKVNYDFREDLTESYRDHINHEKIGVWLDRHLDHKQRIQLLYFLTGLSMVDGALKGREIKVLSELSDSLKISPKEFQRIIGMYQKQEEQSRERKTFTPRKTRLKIASDILGVSEFAAMDEVKKAYRKLVKTHHPDIFFNESEGQQKIAQERFLKIQEAYETIEKLK